MSYFLDIIGTITFTIGGVHKAKSRQLNVFGVVFLGAITAIGAGMLIGFGGGILRDSILGNTPYTIKRAQTILSPVPFLALSSFAL